MASSSDDASSFLVRSFGHARAKLKVSGGDVRVDLNRLKLLADDESFSSAFVAGRPTEEGLPCASCSAAIVMAVDIYAEISWMITVVLFALESL
jgi:hypothetical protein